MVSTADMAGAIDDDIVYDDNDDVLSDDDGMSDE